MEHRTNLASSTSSQQPIVTETDPFEIALAQANLARGRTAPNPPVGAVIIKDGAIVATGFTQPAGQDHAEIVALKLAGEATSGAHLYVTLEPCCHQGRTPPCTDAIIRAGLTRVSVGILDPNPVVRGRGVETLRQAGLEVEVTHQERFRRPVAGFVKRVTTGLPYIICKWAMTLDGKTATSSGHSKWITSAESRELAHDLRDQVDAIIVGINAVLADDPQLTARPTQPSRPPRKNPLRVVLDRKARTPLTSNLVQADDPERTVVAVGPEAPADATQRLRDGGVQLLVIDQPEPADFARSVARWLAEQGVNEALVEGGGETHWSFLAGRLVDEAWAFAGAKILGGRDSKPAVGGAGFHSLDELAVSSIRVQQVGPDAFLMAQIESDWQKSSWCLPG